MSIRQPKFARVTFLVVSFLLVFSSLVFAKEASKEKVTLTVWINESDSYIGPEELMLS